MKNVSEEAAKKLARGNKTEAVALAMRRLLDKGARAGSLFGAHRGSVRVREGVHLIGPALGGEPDAETGREIERIHFCSIRVRPLARQRRRPPAPVNPSSDRRLLAKRGTVRLSAVSVWEIALLVDGRQVELDSPIEAWIARFLERPGIEPAPLGYRAACRSYRLYQLEHRDPADRASDRYRDRTCLSPSHL